jgi:hypothetical protein
MEEEQATLRICLRAGHVSAVAGSKIDHLSQSRLLLADLSLEHMFDVRHQT